jgi:hypothetical protein
MKRILAAPFVILLIIGFAFFTACQDEYLEPEANQQNENLVLKKGGKQTEVDQADLYGDLWVMERDESGVPLLYPLKYLVEYQDVPVDGIIDVVNPKLDGSFDLKVLVRDEAGYVIFDSEGKPQTDNVTIEPNIDGYVVGIDNVIALYDAEGEVLPTVALHVVPIEMGRLNIIRSPSTVISKRLTEVIKNFGDGTVANVTRDFCGRIMMFRTDEAIELGAEDKPIDSPLENLAIYKELMLHGFAQSAEDNGLKFLIEQDGELGGFDLQLRVDQGEGVWDDSPKSYDEFTGIVELTGIDEQDNIIMNLAASCMAAGSDKSNTLLIDEIVFVNLFMGIPEVSGNGIDTQAEEITCFLPTIEQEIRMMDKTDKHEYSRYRYYVDYSAFTYDRTKFQETLLDFVTIVLNGGVSEIVTLKDNMILHDVLMGTAVTGGVIDIEYTETGDHPTTGAFGFACQADDYVQALEVVHNNEEFLVWEKLTPTWIWDYPITWGGFSPFNYVLEEEDHSKRPPGHGDDSTSDGDDGLVDEGGDNPVDDGGSTGGGKGRRR